MADDSSNKRHRKVEDDLICPISLELPVDPVMAADGRIYERLAIKKHFITSDRSPYTNETLKSKDLLDAPQTRNTIETLIESGVITGDLAARWKGRTSYKKELLRQAENGHAEAMGTLAKYFFTGKHDFAEDDGKAYEWSKKAHAAGSVLGTAYLGIYLTNGYGGVESNVNQGTTYLALAAGRGSNFAAYELGCGFVHGNYGLEKDKTEAIRLLEQATSDTCQYAHLSYLCKESARKILDRLKEESS
ncbi:MAG: hypothetical protein SGILL_001165 [Bacillariaceae sp.]